MDFLGEFVNGELYVYCHYDLPKGFIVNVKRYLKRKINNNFTYKVYLKKIDEDYCPNPIEAKIIIKNSDKPILYRKKWLYTFDIILKPKHGG